MFASYEGLPVVVTGCSSGIGQSVARSLLAVGARVTGIDWKPTDDQLDQFIGGDIGSRDFILAAAEQLPRQISAVFSCAGLSGGAAEPFKVLQVNFIGARELLEATHSRLVPGSAIVTVSSGAGFRFLENKEHVLGLVHTHGFDEAEAWAESNHGYVVDRGGYAISKEALILYTLVRCCDLGERGIRINCVAPGKTETPMLKDSAKLYGPELLDRVPKPLNRVATAQEQANVLLFLNGPYASYVNGQIIWTDGGMISSSVLADSTPPELDVRPIADGAAR
jgi:NAD(P)-dependent dehydrogenase (short-subunit alcohol dehydrogenase family)